jgi:transcriptional regulator with XRE-family HTH domain
MLTAAQSRAARALINWSQPQLAQASGTGVSTIRDFETGKRNPIANNLAAIKAALEKAGVAFLSNDGVAIHRVYWRRTQDGDLPPPTALVIINYTIERHQTQPAIFNQSDRTWRLPNVDREVGESEVPQWAPGPWDYRAADWSTLERLDME